MPGRSHGIGSDAMDAVGSAVKALFAICVADAAAHALLGEAGEGVDLVCGLSAALCLARAAARLLG